jgi:hypothetical protein
MAVEWADVEELARLLDLEGVEWVEDHLQHNRDAGIEAVKVDRAGSVAEFDEADPPIDVDERMRQAALRAAIVFQVNTPDDGWRTLHNDRKYQSLMFGHRRNFGVA